MSKHRKRAVHRRMHLKAYWTLLAVQRWRRFTSRIEEQQAANEQSEERPGYYVVGLSKPQGNPP